MIHIETQTSKTASPTPEHLADVNADLTQRVVLDTEQMPWQPSPSGTVWRKPLYRQDGESGPVTSLVRYVPNGAFPEHAHPQGEEILVLDGVFSDEHGDYPAGTFLMNPHDSRHSPRSRSGCTLFVRLRQYPGADRPRLVEDTTAPNSWRPGLVDGLSVRPLYSQGGHPESVRAGALGARHPLSAPHPLGRRRDPGTGGRVLRRTWALSVRDLAAQPAHESAHAVFRDRLPDLRPRRRAPVEDRASCS